MALDALTWYRIGRTLERASIPVVPSLLRSMSRVLHRCSIPYECEIGQGTRLGYGGVGVVVHPSARIGFGTFLCQQVTIEEGVEVGDGVMVGAGAVLRRGIRVGDGAKIGANAVVSVDVSPGTTVVGVRALHSQ